MGFTVAWGVTLRSSSERPRIPERTLPVPLARAEVLLLACPGMPLLAGAGVALLARPTVEPLAGSEEAQLARSAQSPLAGAGREGLAGTEVAQLAGPEAIHLGSPAQPDLARRAAAQLAGAQGDLLRPAGRARSPRDDVRRGARVCHPGSIRLPDSQDLPLGPRLQSADHHPPGTVDNVRPALHGAHRNRPVISLLHIRRRFHGVGEWAGFPACPGDRSLPLDPVGPSPLERALPPRPEALVADDPVAVERRMGAANVPDAYGLDVCWRLRRWVDADGRVAIRRRLPDRTGRGVHREPFHSTARHGLGAREIGASGARHTNEVALLRLEAELDHRCRHRLA